MPVDETVPRVFRLPSSISRVPKTDTELPVGTTQEPSNRPPPVMVTSFFIVTRASTVVDPSAETVNKFATLIPPSNFETPSTSNSFRTTTLPLASTSPVACLILKR